METGEVQVDAQGAAPIGAAPKEVPCGVYIILVLFVFGIYAMGFFFGHHAASLLRNDGSDQRRKQNQPNPYGEIDDP